MEFYLIDHEATVEDIEKFHFSNQKVGVIAHIETLDGKVLLQQRGIKSRDENGLFEDIDSIFSFLLFYFYKSIFVLLKNHSYPPHILFPQ